MQKVSSASSLNKIIIVAALGYFVDIYDLVLFSVERKDSLTSILGAENATPENLKNIGMSLLNWQMGGMLIGGLFWGILGDKKGRLSVLFGSILMYSLANIFNGLLIYVPGDADTIVRFYAGLRLIAG